MYKRIISLILVLTTIFGMTVPIYADRLNGNNFASVTGDTTTSVNFLKGETFDPNKAGTIMTQINAIRVSLVYPESAGDKAGIPVYEPGVIKNNPIHVANSNVYWRSPTAAISVNNIFTPWRTTNERTNSRREYTSWNVAASSQGLDWNTNKPLTYDVKYQSAAGTWLPTTGAIFTTQAYKQNMLFDPGVPDLLGDTKCPYQQNPPSDHPKWATMSNIDYFDSYVKTWFVSSENTTGEQAPDFCLRMLAKMTDHTSEPYSEEVRQIYNTYMEEQGCKILVEPMVCFKNDDSALIHTLFGPADEFPYIMMTFGDIGTIMDCTTGVQYGYTDKGNLNNITKVDGVENIPFPTYIFLLNDPALGPQL